MDTTQEFSLSDKEYSGWKFTDHKKKGVNAIITLDADRSKRNKEFVEELKKIDPNSGFTGGSRHGKRSIELTGDKDKILELMDKHGKDIVADFYED